MKELREFLVSQGDSGLEEIITSPRNAWENYQRMKLAKAEALNRSRLPAAESSGHVKRKGRGLGKKPKKVVTTVQLDPDILEGLQRVAEREERTVSAVIRLAVREYLERENG
ncbi:MAG: ribbon-helix-helix domain-containing protein [Pseudomonadota bacterium]